MPYAMILYPDESEKYPTPVVGDTFVVETIDEDVLDPHWGRCVIVGLRHLPSEEEKWNGM